jgi:hypothetical protein
VGACRLFNFFFVPRPYQPERQSGAPFRACRKFAASWQKFAAPWQKFTDIGSLRNVQKEVKMPVFLTFSGAFWRNRECDRKIRCYLETSIIYPPRCAP